MKSLLLFLALMLLPAALDAQSVTAPPKWKAFEYFLGKWTSTGKGRWGESKITRVCELMMNGTFLQTKNTSLYPQTPGNPLGGVYDIMEMLSYDKARKGFVLRQFRSEEMVNTYVLDSAAAGPKTYVFESASVENFMPGWRAQEKWEIVGDDEFVRTFSLGGPGQGLTEFSRSSFFRVKE